MRYLRLPEACYRLHISDKTMRRWIKQGSIDYKQEQGVYLIPESAITQILARKEATGATPLVGRIEALETQINAIVSRLGAIEARLQEHPPVLTTLTPPRVKYAVPESGNVPAGVPEGAVPYVEFARSHGVAEATLRDHLRKQHIPCVSRPKPGRTGEQERWLTLSDQAAAIRYWIENSTRYTPCDACPHK